MAFSLRTWAMRSIKTNNWSADNFEKHVTLMSCTLEPAKQSNALVSGCCFSSLSIALVHDYVRRVDFTTKPGAEWVLKTLVGAARKVFMTQPRLWTNFFAFALFVRGYSFQLYCIGNSFLWNSPRDSLIFNFITSLGGEICLGGVKHA